MRTKGWATRLRRSTSSPASGRGVTKPPAVAGGAVAIAVAEPPAVAGGAVAVSGRNSMTHGPAHFWNFLTLRRRNLSPTGSQERVGEKVLDFLRLVSKWEMDRDWIKIKIKKRTL